MSPDTPLRPQFISLLGTVLRTLWADRILIALMVVVFAIVGAIAGKLSGSVSSTAQLVLTPLPLRDATTEDDLARMVAEPMDVRTAQLICLGDETIAQTKEHLNASGALEEPVEDLKTLKNALDFEITIEKDTPYETVFSPVVQLTAEGGTPAEAKAIVDAWAETCVAQAEKYKSLRQGPTLNAFENRADDLRGQLDTLEEEMEAFWRENNLELQQQRLNQLIGQVNELKQIRVSLTHDSIREAAKLEAWQAAIAEEEPTRPLRWSPSGALAEVAADALDLDTKTEAGSVLVQEVINPEYDILRSQIVETEASIDSYAVEIQKIDETLAEYGVEIEDLQAQTANLLRVEKRLTRETDFVAQTYEDAAIKARFAEMASNLDQPYLQILSRGAEWRMPRFRGAILFGGAAGAFGFLLAALLSLVIRLAVNPALEAEA